MEVLRDDTSVLPIMRIAAQAAIMMVDKYTVLNEECEIYFIAIGMFLPPNHVVFIHVFSS